MKHLTKVWSVLALLAAFTLISCEEDEPTIEVDEDGLALADGYYFAREGEDPTAETQLVPEKVEGEGNAAVDREGFFGNYVFLQSGTYTLQQVEAREVVSTLGGELSMVPADSLEGDEVSTGYELAIMEQDGNSLSLDADGFYKISYDEQTSELILMEVVTVSVIGAADVTVEGWSDNNLTKTGVNAEGNLVFELSDVEFRAGDFKVRINNGWKIIRGEGADQYIPFTNYGGTLETLVPGGSNISFPEEMEGVYDIEILLSNSGGAAIAFNNKRDVAPIVFDPDKNKWAITGAATPNGWADDDSSNDPIGTDIDFNYEGETNGTHTWVIDSIDLTNDVFKFRANDAWTKNLGYSGVTVAGPDADKIVAAAADDNFENTQSGKYKITLSTSDEGDSYTVSFELLEAYTNSGFNPDENQWAVVGAATEIGWPSNNDCGAADQDVDLTYDGESNGTHSWSATIALTADAFKFRKNDCWDGDMGYAAVNITGASASNFSEDSGNLKCDVAGTYAITLSTSDDGASYSVNFSIQ